MPQDDIQRSLGRLEAKVDILLSRSEDRDQRIAKLEQGAAQQRTVVAVIGVFAGTISAYASKLLGIT